MEENKATNEVKTNKYSYEELENICHQLSEQARTLYTQLQEANLSNIYTRLSFLFKVMENAAMFDADFTDKCSNEIVRLMAVEEDDSEKTE